MTKKKVQEAVESIESEAQTKAVSNLKGSAKMTKNNMKIEKIYNESGLLKAVEFWVSESPEITVYASAYNADFKGVEIERSFANAYIGIGWMADYVNDGKSEPENGFFARRSGDTDFGVFGYAKAYKGQLGIPFDPEWKVVYNDYGKLKLLNFSNSQKGDNQRHHMIGVEKFLNGENMRIFVSDKTRPYFETILSGIDLPSVEARREFRSQNINRAVSAKAAYKGAQKLIETNNILAAEQPDVLAKKVETALKSSIKVFGTDAEVPLVDLTDGEYYVQKIGQNKPVRLSLNQYGAGEERFSILAYWVSKGYQLVVGK